MKNKKIYIYTILLLLLMPACICMARVYTEKKSFDFKDFKKPALYADLAENDSITIIGLKARQNISIKAVLKAESGSRAASKLLLNQIEPEIIRVKDIIYIKTLRHKSKKMSQKGFFQRFQSLLSMVNDNDYACISYIVSLPESTGVKISSSSLLDTLRINNIEGGLIGNASFKKAYITDNNCPVALKTGKEFSNYEIFQHKGPVLASGSGQIYFKNIIGNININNWSTGDIEFISCYGNITYSGSSSVLLKSCFGSVKVENINAPVKILKHSDSDVNVFTESGPIILDHPLADGKINIQTASGTVVVGFRDESKGRMRFETGPQAPVDINLLPFIVTELNDTLLSGYLRTLKGVNLSIKSKSGQISLIPSDSISR
jgi:hypothetical protein